jgi:nucleoside-diphosphate-sugar epimerase
MSRILVTGASGFIGRNLCRRLIADGHQLTALSRTGKAIPGAENLSVDFEASHELPTLDGIEVVFHLAACVPHSRINSRKSEHDFLRMNRDVTLALAENANRFKVRRFIFLSTTSIFGAQSPLGKIFSENDTAHPGDLYAASKYAAEIALANLQSQAALELTIIRAPLVYGAEAPGKFAQLVRLVASGIPLPLAAMDNKRSLIHIDNLVDALALCAEHPHAANKLYVVSDGTDVSTPDLIRYISTMLRKPARLVRVPLGILRLLLRLIGKQQVVDNLAASFRVDNSKIRKELGWVPAIKIPSQANAPLR